MLRIKDQKENDDFLKIRYVFRHDIEIQYTVRQNLYV